MTAALARGQRRARPAAGLLGRASALISSAPTLPGGASALIGGVLALLGGVLSLLVAAPAAAHPGSAAVVASDYRSRLVAVEPSVPGLAVRLIRNGRHVQVRNDTGKEVVVRGYGGEPYLRITPSAVFVNTTSPTAYANDTLDGSPPVGTGSATSWRRIRDEPVADWHDHRTHWLPATLPPVAAAQPARPHRLSNWTVQLSVGERAVEATGTLDYVPPPRASVWWAAVLAAASAFLLLGGHMRVLAGGLAVAALGALADGAGRAIDVGSSGWGAPAAMLLDDPYATLSALAALAAAAFAVRRATGGPEHGLFALALAGSCLAVLGGAVHAPVLWHGGAPVPWSAEVSRVCIAAVMAVGAGVTAAASLRLRTHRYSLTGPESGSPPVTEPALGSPPVTDAAAGHRTGVG